MNQKNNSMRISSLSTYFPIIWWTNLSYWKKHTSKYHVLHGEAWTDVYLCFSQSQIFVLSPLIIFYCSPYSFWSTNFFAQRTPVKKSCFTHRSTNSGLKTVAVSQLEICIISPYLVLLFTMLCWFSTFFVSIVIYELLFT